MKIVLLYLLTSLLKFILYLESRVSREGETERERERDIFQLMGHFPNHLKTRAGPAQADI